MTNVICWKIMSTLLFLSPTLYWVVYQVSTVLIKHLNFFYWSLFFTLWLLDSCWYFLIWKINTSIYARSIISICLQSSMCLVNQKEYLWSIWTSTIICSTLDQPPGWPPPCQGVYLKLKYFFLLTDECLFIGDKL